MASAWGGADRHTWIGPIAVGAAIGVQLLWWPAPKRQLCLLAITAGIGTIVECGFLAAGVTRFHEPPLGGFLCPIWMIGLWVNFGATLNHSLAWLAGKPVLAAVFGAVGGPLSYWAGARWGAIELGPHATPALAITWGLVTPFLFWIARLPGIRVQPPDR